MQERDKREFMGVSERVGAAFRSIYKHIRIEPTFSGENPGAWGPTEEQHLKKYLLAIWAKTKTRRPTLSMGKVENPKEKMLPKPETNSKANQDDNGRLKIERHRRASNRFATERRRSVTADKLAASARTANNPKIPKPKKWTRRRSLLLMPNANATKSKSAKLKKLRDMKAMLDRQEKSELEKGLTDEELQLKRQVEQLSNFARKNGIHVNHEYVLFNEEDQKTDLCKVVSMDAHGIKLKIAFAEVYECIGVEDFVARLKKGTDWQKSEKVRVREMKLEEKRAQKREAEMREMARKKHKADEAAERERHRLGMIAREKEETEAREAEKKKREADKTAEKERLRLAELAQQKEEEKARLRDAAKKKREAEEASEKERLRLVTISQEKEEARLREESEAREAARKKREAEEAAEKERLRLAELAQKKEEEEARLREAARKKREAEEAAEKERLRLVKVAQEKEEARLREESEAREAARKKREAEEAAEKERLRIAKLENEKRERLRKEAEERELARQTREAEEGAERERRRLSKANKEEAEEAEQRRKAEQEIQRLRKKRLEEESRKRKEKYDQQSGTKTRTGGRKVAAMNPRRSLKLRPTNSAGEGEAQSHPPTPPGATRKQSMRLKSAPPPTPGAARKQSVRLKSAPPPPPAAAVVALRKSCVEREVQEEDETEAPKSKEGKKETEESSGKDVVEKLGEVTKVNKAKKIPRNTPTFVRGGRMSTALRTVKDDSEEEEEEEAPEPKSSKRRPPSPPLQAKKTSSTPSHESPKRKEAPSNFSSEPKLSGMLSTDPGVPPPPSPEHSVRHDSNATGNGVTGSAASANSTAKPFAMLSTDPGVPPPPPPVIGGAPNPSQQHPGKSDALLPPPPVGTPPPKLESSVELPPPPRLSDLPPPPSLPAPLKPPSGAPPPLTEPGLSPTLRGEPKELGRARAASKQLKKCTSYKKVREQEYFKRLKLEKLKNQKREKVEKESKVAAMSEEERLEYERAEKEKAEQAKKKEKHLKALAKSAGPKKSLFGRGKKFFSRGAKKKAKKKS
jgi:hypothetical protein